MDVTEPLSGEQPSVATGTTDLRLDRAFDALRESSVSVLSLDVFDTLLWRRVADPVDAFPIVGERLRERGLIPPGVGAIEFKQVRIAAEAKARSERIGDGRGGEVSLDDIYEKLHWREFSGAGPEVLSAVELEVERELLVPDLDVTELVSAARALGKQVIAVSDTYFSELELRELLDPYFTLETAIDRVFSSSDHGVGKTTTLFEIVLRELDVEPRAVVHVGDNEHADVESARQHGIRTVHFERREKELERILERERRYLDAERVWAGGDAGVTALRTKTLARREVVELPERLRPFWRYGAAALGPALTGFAEWVQTELRSRGIERAYCLMREGALLAKLVNGADAYVGAGITAEPLWLSRQVCARASIFEGTPEELEALLSRRQPPTVRELCATLQVEPDLSPTLRANAEARLGERALADEVLAELTSNPELRGPLVDEARRLRARVVERARACVPGGEGELALVDLGWGATIQKLLQDILQRERVDILTIGLYLVTHDLATERIVAGLDVSGYLGSCGVPSAGVRSLMRSPEILEQLCMPDVGSQIDLTPELEPVLSEPVDAALVQSAERGAAQAGILAFQREWMRYAQVIEGPERLVGEGVRRLLLAQVARATVSPTSEEASVFSGWVHDENFGSQGSDSIVGGRQAARALRYMDAEALIALPMSELYWPFGLAALEDEHLAEAADAVTMGLLPAEALRSVVEVGDFDVYYDNGFGFGESWKVALEAKRNRFGLSYVRADLRADEIRGLRLDPVKAPSVLRIDWIALKCWVRGEPSPADLVFHTAEALERFTIRGVSPLGPKLWTVAGDDPQFELSLERLLGARPYHVVVECGFAVMPAAPAREDAHAIELRRRSERRSRAVKRFVRQVENRAGVPVGEPLRRAWRRLRRG